MNSRSSTACTPSDESPSAKPNNWMRLSHACGELYSQTVVSYWRMVRKHGLWLKPKQLMRWHTCLMLHAHTSDARVHAFFAALDSWRQRRKTDPTARPPRKRKWYFRIE